MKVLIVEIDPVVKEQLRSLLETLDCTDVQASEGNEAFLIAFQDGGIELVIANRDLEFKDAGLALLKVLRRPHEFPRPHIPTILYGHDFDDLEGINQFCYEQCTSYMLYPVDRESMKSQIRVAKSQVKLQGYQN